MAEKKVIELEINTNADSIKKQFADAKREVQQMADAFGESSEQALKAARRAAELKDIIDDSAEAIKNLQGGGAFSALSSSLSVVASGFTAVQGAIGLVGVESEKVEEAILKVQSAMALAEGLRGVEDLGRSFKALGAVIGQTAIGQKILTGLTVVYTGVQKALNFVMKQNPIFLIIGAVTALGGAYALLTQDTEDLTQANDNLNASYDRVLKKFNQTNQQGIKDRENRIKILESEGASEKRLQEERLKLADAREQVRQKELVFQRDFYKKQEAQRKRAIADEDWELANKIAEEKSKTRIRIDELKSLENDLATEKTVLINEYNTKEKEANAKRLAQRKEANDKILAEELRLRDQLKADILANDQEQIDANKLKTEKLLEQEQAYADAVAEARKYNIESVLSDQEKEIKAINDKYAKIAELGELNKDLIIAQKNEINAVNVEYAQKEVKLEQLTAEKKIEIAKQTSNDLISIVEFIGTRNKKAAKVAFNVTKALNIANAVMDTYKAATNALANVPAPYNFVAAGVSIVAGLANVAKIASQKFDDSGGSNVPSGGGSIASGSTTAGLSQQTAPSFNLVGQSGGGQFLQQQPIQAYVVSGEVTSQQSLDRNRLFNATFG